MANEIILAESSIKKELSLSGDDVRRVVAHLEQVKEAVRQVMKEGINNDFAIIPGTPKKALLKPGAEKLMKLFGLGVRFRLIDKEFDRFENFALFSYEAEVYHLSTGTVLASCEGTANSQEKKYKERNVYSHGKKVAVEAVPVCDILNTLKKMAQKRAMVGATIIAVGASDYFSQDDEEVEASNGINKEIEKKDSGRFESYENTADFVCDFGKFRGIRLGDIKPDELSNYVEWTAKNNAQPNGKLKEFLDRARDHLKKASA